MTENITQFPTPASADLTENQQALLARRRRNTPPHRSKPPKERPPRRRDYGYLAWLLSEGYDAETALNWTDRIAKGGKADAGADMGGNSDV